MRAATLVPDFFLEPLQVGKRPPAAVEQEIGVLVGHGQVRRRPCFSSPHSSMIFPAEVFTPPSSGFLKKQPAEARR